MGRIKYFPFILDGPHTVHKKHRCPVAIDIPQYSYHDMESAASWRM